MKAGPALETDKWRKIRPETLLFAAVFFVVLYLAVVPLGFLLWNTFVIDGSLTLSNVREAFGGTIGIGQLAWNTSRYAIGSTIVSLSLATVLAYLAVRTDVPFRRLIFISTLVPLIVPGILHTISWIFLASERSGWLNNFIGLWFDWSPFNIRSMAGMIWIEATNQLPLLFLFMYAAFRSMDPALEESALSHGASMPRVLRSVTLPVLKPSLLSAAFISIVLALESFEGPALVGMPAGILVFTSRIFMLLRQFPPEYGQAGAFSTVLVVLMAFGVFAYSRLGRSTAGETITGKGFRPRRYELGPWRIPVGIAVLVYLILTTALPLAVLILMSFQKFYAPPTAETLGNLTVENYAYTFNNPDVLGAFFNSLVLSTGAATVVMLLMVVAAWLVVRSRIRGAWSLDAISFLPIAIPGIVMGVALLVAYLYIPIPVYGTLWILLIAYCTRYMPYGMRYGTASMHQIGGELEEAAKTSGASTLQTLGRVVLPLVMPGFIAGWIFIVMSAIRELSSSILLYAPETRVLGVVIWDLWETGLVTELAAAGVVMMFLLALVALLAKLLGDRFGVQGDSGPRL